LNYKRHPQKYRADKFHLARKIGTVATISIGRRINRVREKNAGGQRSAQDYRAGGDPVVMLVHRSGQAFNRPQRQSGSEFYSHDASSNLTAYSRQVSRAAG